MTKREFDGKLWKFKSGMWMVWQYLNPSIHPLNAWKITRKIRDLERMKEEYGGDPKFVQAANK